MPTEATSPLPELMSQVILYGHFCVTPKARLGRKQRMSFPSEVSASHHTSNNTILEALERMGFKGEMTGDGFRGVASTILHEQGYAHDHIGVQLAHGPRDSVSAAYNYAR